MHTLSTGWVNTLNFQTTGNTDLFDYVNVIILFYNILHYKKFHISYLFNVYDVFHIVWNAYMYVRNTSSSGSPSCNFNQARRVL